MKPPAGLPPLTPMERDILSELSNIAMGSAATALSALTGRKVTITTPRVEQESIEAYFGPEGPRVLVRVPFAEGLVGENWFVLRLEDARIITHLMLRGDPATAGEGDRPAQLDDDLVLSALSEAMNQMLGSATTALSSFLDQKITIAPPEAALAPPARLVSAAGPQPVEVRFTLEIPPLLESYFIQVLPLEAARQLVEFARQAQEVETPETRAGPGEASGGTTAAPRPAGLEGGMAAGTGPAGGAAAPAGGPPGPRGAGPVASAPAAGGASGPGGAGTAAPGRPGEGGVARTAERLSFPLLSNVPVRLLVRLGSRAMTVSEVLGLSRGSLVVLPVAVDEPVEVLVDDIPVARGEVVVVGERLGLRITQLTGLGVNPRQRPERL